MTRTSLLLAFTFLAGACGGSDPEPKGPSTTQATAPDEKSEDNIQMSAGNPPASKKQSKPAAATETKPAEPKPAEPKPAEPPAPATAPK